MSEVKLNGLDQSSQRVVTIPLSQSSKSSEANVNASASDIKPALVVQASQKAEGQQKNIESAVTKLNDYVQSVQRNLQFNLDDESGKTVITVVDRNTSAVIRQIPDDVALKLAQDLQQDEPLSLFNAKV